MGQRDAVALRLCDTNCLNPAPRHLQPPAWYNDNWAEYPNTTRRCLTIPIYTLQFYVWCCASARLLLAFNVLLCCTICVHFLTVLASMKHELLEGEPKSQPLLFLNIKVKKTGSTFWPTMYIAYSLCFTSRSLRWCCYVADKFRFCELTADYVDVLLYYITIYYSDSFRIPVLLI